MARFIVAVLLSLSLAPTARAQDKETVARARLYFETGRLLFEQADFEQAAKKFTAGYELLPRPQFLLNTGLCYQKMAQLDRAHAMYERYLKEAAKDDPDRERAKTWLAEVDARIATLRSATRPLEPPPRPTAETPASAPPTVHVHVPVVDETPPPTSNDAANLNLILSRPPRRSFLQRNWWILPVGAVALGGAAVGIYFAVRPNTSCLPTAAMPCLDLR